MGPSRAEVLTGEVDIPTLKATIEAQSKGTAYKIREFVTSTQEKLDTADTLINKAESLAEPWKVSKRFVSDLLAPAREVVNLLDAIGDIHPAIKVVAGVVKVVVKLELDRHENDKQIGVVFFTMSSLLILLSALDPIFEVESSGVQSLLKEQLNNMCDTIKDFGNFCDVYYRQKSSFIKTLRSGKYKDKLSGYAGDFTEQKKELQLLLSSYSALTMQDFQTNYQADMKKISAFIDTMSTKDKNNEEILRQMGGADRVMQDDKLIDEFAKRLKEEVDSVTRRAVKTDLEDALRANEDLYELKLERSMARIEAAVTYSTDTIIAKMDAGPHEFIEDPDIKLVWQEMRASTSTKIRVFLDAVYHHFNRQFTLEEFKSGKPHPDKWTLNFLSKVIFYPTMGDAIDDDCSGFVSVHEVDKFLKSRPSGWSVPQWIAFWAAGPYLNDTEYQEKIEKLQAELDGAIDDTSEPEEGEKCILDVNKKRVKYFVNGISRRLNLITIYDQLLKFYGESMTNDEVYGEIQKLRVQWRTIQEEQIAKNLERSKYRLQSEEAVSLILGTPRIEQYLLCFIYMMLQRHIKVINLAKVQVVAIAEFQDLRASWEFLFDAFEGRMFTLIELWRQQRRDVKVQVECYSAGLFEDWYKQFGADQSDSDNEDDSDEDSDENGYYSEDEENDVEDPDEARSQTPSVKVGKSEKTLDATELLLHPVPTEPEDDAELTTDEDSDWESPEEKRKKAEKELLNRVESMEQKLGTVESLLRKLLAVQGVNMDEEQHAEASRSAETNKTALGDDKDKSPGKDTDNSNNESESSSDDESDTQSNADDSDE
ncbi:hypothetical protein M422DRAFT_776699, partial [Sphaerobolus stellatus SS14]